MSLGTVKTPTIQQIGQVAVELGFNFNDADLAAHLEALGPAFAAYNILDQMPDELPPVSYPRCPGRRPTSEENPHGAWYVKTEVPGGGSGKLAGKRIALKDNICLAGVPMMNGASTLEGYVPDVDATVATRILDAGGTIVGKTVGEYFSASRAVATPARPGRCITRIVRDIRPAAHHRAAPPSWLPERCLWPWAATRVARSASRPRSAGSMG